jgi:hypothetical protein
MLLPIAPVQAVYGTLRRPIVVHRSQSDGGRSLTGYRIAPLFGVQSTNH